MFCSILIFIFLFGLSVGSFLSAWVYRLKNGKSIVYGRSVCDHCTYVLKWYDLVPVLSFGYLRGKCRQCQKKISLQYPWVELVTGILFVFVVALNFSRAEGLSVWFIAYHLLAVFFLEAVFLFDLLYGEIPLRFTVFPAVIFVVLSFFLHSSFSVVLGALVGALFFAVQFFVSKGKWVGSGDIGMGVLLGSIVGWPLVFLTLLLAYVGGTLFFLPFLILKKMNKKSKIPLGTFLSVATFFAMMWGEKITSFLPW